MSVAAAVLIARITVLAPNSGMHQEFEAGYKRHLDWHRGQRDPWTWHGWSVISGERAGWFIDATVDRTPQELDAPVAPAEDWADNNKNVLPYARLVSSSIYRLRPDLGTGETPVIASPFVSMIEFRVPAREKARFESAIQRKRLPGVCFELISGGATPSYLLFRPADKLSTLVTFDPLIEGVDSADVQALRYRRDLTYVPAP